MTEKEIIKFYHEKKIFYVRLEFIKDFLFYLLDTVDLTYLGDDLMTIQNKKEHFEYSLNKTIVGFKDLGLAIDNNIELESFLFDIFFKFYYDTKKTKKNIENFKIRINIMLTYSITKKPAQLIEMVNYYDIFEKSLGSYLIF